MACLGRLFSRAVLFRQRPNNLTRIRVAGISTTKKDKDTTIVSTNTQLFRDDLPEKFDARVVNKHWVSWGWDFEDREQDVTFVHLFFFVYITLCLVTGTYFITYSPPRHLKDWAQREAYLEMKRRESAGLPYIDRDIVPLDPAQLPTEEELTGTEIFI